MEAREAFPGQASLIPPASAREASRSAQFAAPYDDVFRAAVVAAGQALLNIEEQQKSAGMVYASRSLTMPPHGTSEARRKRTQHTYFYAISVRELGPKTSEVRISAKVQGGCDMVGAGIYMLTAGVLTKQFNDENDRCRALTAGMWADGEHSSEPEMQQFLALLRNQLVAAGLI
jgi:hypothetical protein